MEAREFTKGYVRRIVDDELDELVDELPAILLDGPKAVGKTSTALRRARSVRRLDVAAERAIVEADPAIIASDDPPVLIDEWQRVPEVFDTVRRLVDDDPSGGRFILTGSAPVTQTHSGAGRIATIRMRPLTLAERLGTPPSVSLAGLVGGTAEIGGRCSLRLNDYVDEIVIGGFPGLRHLGTRARDHQLDGYLERIVDHDLPEAGRAVRHPSTVSAWLRAYAAAVGTSASWDKIRNAATSGVDDKPARTTTVPYIELLTRLGILDPLPAWSPTHNHLAALTGSPKHFLADPALAARLVRLGSAGLTRGAGPDEIVPRDGAYLGALFESLAALCLRTYAQRHRARVSHVRTMGGRHEVDFLVESESGCCAIEVKLSSTVNDRDVRHLLWLREQLSPSRVNLVVLHTGPEAYRRPDGVAVVPLGLLTP